MKKKTKVLLVSLLILTGYVLARPYVHIVDGWIVYRPSMTEKYHSVQLWK